jgi:hypothetical protein
VTGIALSIGDDGMDTGWSVRMEQCIPSAKVSHSKCLAAIMDTHVSVVVNQRIATCLLSRLTRRRDGKTDDACDAWDTATGFSTVLCFAEGMNFSRFVAQPVAVNLAIGADTCQRIAIGLVTAGWPVEHGVAEAVDAPVFQHDIVTLSGRGRCDSGGDLQSLWTSL